MKKQIIKKCLSFIVIIIFFVSIIAINNSCSKGTSTDTGIKNNPLGSTIIYKDLNPDSVITCNSAYSLDLNNDGIDDFIIKTVCYNVKCDARIACGIGIINAANAVPANGSNNGINYTMSPDYAASLDSLTIIDSSSNWSYNTIPALSMYALSSCRCGNYYSYGPWYIHGNVDRYTGLKLVKGGNAYYGWVRLNANTNPVKLIVKDYAYNSSPNQPIIAGQKK